MSHFAELDSNNYVINVIFVKDEDFRKYIENEETEGIKYLQNIFGLHKRWVQTSYNTLMNQHRFDGIPLRGKYAEIGDKYDENKNLFIPPKPYNSWIFDETTCSWVSPIPKPKDENWYFWNEENLKWEVS